MKNRLEYIAFAVLAFLFQTFGLKFSRKLSSPLALFFYFLVPIRKDVVIKNLTFVFSDLREKEIKRLAYKNYKSFMIFFIEMLCLPKLSKDQIMAMIFKEDVQILVEKRNEKKGVILLTAHFGNWEVAALAASYNLNLRFNVVAKSLRNNLVDDWINKMRTSGINEVINMHNIRKSLEVLKNNEILAILGDQRGPQEGIKIKFFGKETSVFTGPAAFAVKTGAPIVYMIIVRQPDYKYKIYAQEISLNNLPNNEEDQIVELTKRHMALLEEYIRKYPEQWFWMHNRWKH